MDGDYKDEPSDPSDSRTDNEEINKIVVSDFDSDEDSEIIFSNTMDEQLYTLIQVIKCLDESLANHENLEDNEFELILNIDQEHSLELSLFSLEILNTFLSDNKTATNPFFSYDVCDILQNIIEKSHHIERIYLSLKCANSMTHGQGQNHFKLKFDFILSIVSRGFEIAMNEGLNYIHNDNIQICCLSILSELANINFPNEAIDTFSTNIVPYLKDCLDNDATCSNTIELISTLIQKKFNQMAEIFDNPEFLTEISSLIDRNEKVNINILKLIKILVENDNLISPFVLDSNFLTKFIVYDESKTNEYMFLVFEVLGYVAERFHFIRLNFDDKNQINSTISNIRSCWKNIMTIASTIFDSSIAKMKINFSKFFCHFLEIGNEIRELLFDGNMGLVEKMIEAAEGSDVNTVLVILTELNSLASFKFDQIFTSEEIQEKIDDLGKLFEDNDSVLNSIESLKSTVRSWNNQ